MVLEVAILNIKIGTAEQFETNFRAAVGIISKSKGFIDLKLQKCLEQEDKYLLLVNWENLESHTEGFRQSAGYSEWKHLLHHFYDPFPTVEHYADILNA